MSIARRFCLTLAFAFVSFYACAFIAIVPFAYASSDEPAVQNDSQNSFDSSASIDQDSSQISSENLSGSMLNLSQSDAQNNGS